MKYLKQTLSIFKTRWQELILIIGLNQFALVTLNYIAGKMDSESTSLFLPMLFAVVVMIIASILLFGFLRTSLTAPLECHSPTDLLKTGKKFFWRVICLSLIFSGVIFLVSATLPHLLLDFINNTDLAQEFSVAAGRIIIIKPMIFTFACLYVLDCKFTESLLLFKKYDLGSANGALILYLLVTALVFLQPDIGNAKNFSNNALAQFITVSALSQILDIAITVIAIRFVAAEELGYDSLVQPEIEQTEETMEEEND